MRVGEPNALFLADLAANTPDAEMRRRWNENYYGKPDQRPPIDFVKGWRKFHGRT